MEHLLQLVAIIEVKFHCAEAMIWLLQIIKGIHIVCFEIYKKDISNDLKIQKIQGSISQQLH